MPKKLRITGLAVVFMLSMMLAACGGSSDDEASDGSPNDGGNSEGTELGGKDITLPYVSWAGSVVRSHLTAKVLEDVGYNVDLKQVEAGPMWTSVADDADTFSSSGWIPTTHEEYIEEYKDDVEIFDQPNVEKAPLALTVPEYMEDVNSIEDLKGNDELGEAVDWTIVGIDPGAGIMNSTEKAIDNYGLDRWELQSSSESAMLAELQKKIENEEPIVVPLWKPHWIFAAEDLKMLDDPDEIYGGDGDSINTFVNNEFKDKHPAAYKILKQFAASYEGEDGEEMMDPVFTEDKDPEDVAEQFMEDHPDKVEEWQAGVAKE